MSFQIRDSITPDIARKMRALADTRPVMEAVGAQLVSLTKRAFDDPSLRPTPWKPLTPATLAGKAKRGESRSSGCVWASTTRACKG